MAVHGLDFLLAVLCHELSGVLPRCTRIEWSRPFSERATPTPLVQTKLVKSITYITLAPSRSGGPDTADRTKSGASSNAALLCRSVGCVSLLNELPAAPCLFGVADKQAQVRADEVVNSS